MIFQTYLGYLKDAVKAVLISGFFLKQQQQLFELCVSSRQEEQPPFSSFSETQSEEQGKWPNYLSR